MPYFIHQTKGARPLVQYPLFTGAYYLL